MPRRRPGDRRLWLRTSEGGRWTLFAFQLLPIPGIGAAILGWRNPHTRLLRNGCFQATLVLFGSWPLIVPGALGVAWAIWDAVRIAQARLLPLPPRDAPMPTDEAPAAVAAQGQAQKPRRR